MTESPSPLTMLYSRHTRRREFISGLGSAAAWPVVARAQQPTVQAIGYLSPQSAEDDYKNITGPLLQGLKETGHVEGQNVAVEYRYAESQFDRNQSLTLRRSYKAWPGIARRERLDKVTSCFSGENRDIFRGAHPSGETQKQGTDCG